MINYIIMSYNPMNYTPVSGNYPLPYTVPSSFQNQQGTTPAKRHKCQFNTQEFQNYNEKWKVSHWSNNNKTKKSQTCLLVISPHLSQLMGFGGGKLSCLDFSQDDPISSIYQSDIFLLTPRNLIVMCDIAAGTIFGGQHLRLLKLVANNVQDTPSDLCSFEFIHHEFVQLGVKDFDLLVSVMWIQLGEKLRQILQFLQEYKLSLNPSKFLLYSLYYK